MVRSVHFHGEAPTISIVSRNLSTFFSTSNFLPDCCIASAVAMACTDCDTCCFYIAPLKQCCSFRKGSCANLASVDQRSDMCRTHRVMAVLADNRTASAVVIQLLLMLGSPSLCASA